MRALARFTSTFDPVDDSAMLTVFSPRPGPLAILLAALSVLLGTGAARADEEVLRFNQTSVDLGAVSDSTPLLHAFTFINVSNRVVRIGMTHCHFCDEPFLDKRLLHPGEQGTVVLEINPAGRKGQAVANATLQEEGKPRSGASIELKAFICPRVWVEPVHMFPRIPRGETATATVYIISRSKDLKVKEITGVTPIDGFEVGPPEEVEECGSKATRRSITIRFPADLPQGPYNNSLRIVTSEDLDNSRSISVDGQVVGRLAFEPASIGALMQPGENFLLQFEIVAQGAVLVESVDILQRDQIQSAALDVQPTANPGRARITISGTAPMRQRHMIDLRVEVQARTLDSGQVETIVVPINLSVRVPRPQ